MLRAGAGFVAVLLTVIASGSAIFAQAAPPRPGITVLGRGAVRRPADVVRFVIVVGNRQTPASAFSGADALVAALKRAGIADAAIANPLNNIVSAQSFLSIVGSMRKPTPDKVRELVAAVEAALPANAVTIQSVNFMLGLDDCTEAEGVATRAAMDDARARAGRVAEAAHVELAAPLAISEFSASAVCPTKPDPSPLGNQQFDPFSAGSSLDVLISVTSSVTFGIR